MYNALASGYRLDMTDIRPLRLSSSIRVSFSGMVVGDALRTSLCGENGDDDGPFMVSV